MTAAGGVLPAGTETTLYVAGGLFERVTKPSGVIEYKHYIVGDAEPVAIRTLRSNSVNDTRYLHKDHLGSIDTITDESGSVVARLSYDAFGNRRNPATWSGTPSAGEWSTIAAVTHRGFTFHEHLDNVGLIHMNGRVFDQKIGRFLSADPFVQAPGFSQSFNRYSYTFNNPLSFVDPSGYEAQGPDDERNDYAPSRFLYSFFSSVQRGFYYNGVSGRCTACALSRQYANEHRLPRESVGTQWTGAAARGSAVSGAGQTKNAELFLDAIRNFIKSKRNGSSEFTIGDKPFNVIGGTSADRVQTEADLRKIFQTPRGAQLLLQLETRRNLFLFKRDFVIDLTVVNNAYTYAVSDTIFVDPNFHPTIQTTIGSVPASTLRILAHELGHAVFGTLDDGPSRMNNVLQNENPVVTVLGQLARTRY